jgi:outer membrane lipoprotein carrier protein
MFDENSFDIRYFKNSSNYIVRFLSKENSIRSFINEFILTFDKRSLRVIEIRMIENSEDYTLLKFINQSFNEPVSNEIFSN